MDLQCDICMLDMSFVLQAATGPLEAAGLVLESNPDGRITVKWPDGSISHCYPQELYIASGDVSFLQDPLWSCGLVFMWFYSHRYIIISYQ